MTLSKSQPKPGSVREMIAMALPMLISFACDTVMIFTDRLLLSRLGPDSMNAALGGGLSFYMMITLLLGLTGYTTALVAQYLGANRKNTCAIILTQAVILALAAWPLIILCRPLASGLFNLMGISTEQSGPQLIYFNALVLGAVLPLVRHCFASFFTGIGSTRVVMGASLLAMVVNVFASWILIFGKFGFPELGIVGAAYGSLFASFCAILVLVGTYLSPKIRNEYRVLESFVFRAEVMKKLLRYGTPSGVEMFLSVTAFNFMVMIFHSLGPVPATAASIVLNWDMVTYVPLMGIEIGVTSLVGRYMGAGQPDIAHRSVMSGIKVGSMYSLLMLILFLFFPTTLVTVFEPVGLNEVFDHAVPAAVFMLRLVSLYLVSEIVLVVFIGALRGAGDTMWTMCFGVGMHWIMAAALFVMLRIWHFSIEKAWAIFIGMFLVLSTILIFRYRAGKWRTLRIVEPALD